MWDSNYIKQDDITKLKDLNELHTKPFGVVSYIYGINPPSNMDHSITFEDFSKVDLRVGTIIEVNDFPEARNPAYQLTIDFGSLGIKKSSAQITTRYKKDELLNRQIIAVVNFPTKQIAKFMSECLVLGAVNGKDVILLNPEHQVKNGSVVS
jgi:tRNA-binding protein